MFKEDQVLAPAATPGGSLREVNIKSTCCDVPILEYRPKRSFVANQSFTRLFQLFAGANLPYNEPIGAPSGVPAVNLKTV